jgi:hypothetical protein
MMILAASVIVLTRLTSFFGLLRISFLEKIAEFPISWPTVSVF